MKTGFSILMIIILIGCKKDEPTPDSSLTGGFANSVCFINQSTCEGCTEFYSRSYLNQYISSLGLLTDSFANESLTWMIDSAHTDAQNLAMQITCMPEPHPFLSDLSYLLQDLQYDTCLTQDERNGYIAMNNYFDLVSPAAWPGQISVQACP